uniref:Uncharacterized protein n=1 Tax=Glossina palpalis gambiensis TaxID=67801 RepID=A0A1B0B6Q6_9MUSC
MNNWHACIIFVKTAERTCSKLPVTRARYYTLPTTAITTVITHYCYISKKTINNKSIVSSYTIFEKWLSTPQLLGGIRYVPSRYGRRIVLAFMLAITPNVGRLIFAAAAANAARLLAEVENRVLRELEQNITLNIRVNPYAHLSMIEMS